jgi:hypothetical protein
MFLRCTNTGQGLTGANNDYGAREFAAMRKNDGRAEDEPDPVG